MKPLSTNEVVAAEADNALNTILDTVEFLESGSCFPDALRYISILEKGLAQVKESAIVDAVIGGESATSMADALQINRQTFYNRHSTSVKKAKQQEQADMLSFAEDKAESTFKNGELTKTGEKLDSYYAELDDEQEAYYHSFLDAIEDKLTTGGDWKEPITKALKAHAIPLVRISEANKKAERYAKKEYLTDDDGEPNSFVPEGDEFYRLAALNSLNPKDERKDAILKAWKAMMEAEDKAYKAAHPTEADPFEAFGLPAAPAAAKLPANLIEAWGEFQDEAKKAGRKPTRDAFAKLYGVSRATFSRALKKAEEEANAQK